MAGNDSDTKATCGFPMDDLAFRLPELPIVDESLPRDPDPKPFGPMFLAPQPEILVMRREDFEGNLLEPHHMMSSTRANLLAWLCLARGYQYVSELSEPGHGLFIRVLAYKEA